ncbi:hypothetical protein [Ruegeria hyattellae]|uniref:hypothetical protein n=1 Tax=Ruegeria hyattellae TaxID=3233337 RepID=UPI00355B97F2
MIHRQSLQRTPNRASNLLELARFHPAESAGLLADEIEAALAQSLNTENANCFALTDLLNLAGDMDDTLHWAAQANALTPDAHKRPRLYRQDAA